MKPQLLRLHRWLTLIFAIPLAAVIVSGLILSVEPILYDRQITGKSISLSNFERALAAVDPDRKANTLNLRAYENVAIVSEGRGQKSIRIDLTTHTLVPATRRLWSDLLTTTRRLHESLLLDLKWLVDAATIAMLVSMFLALIMGWQKFRSTLGGWHRTTGWLLSPLLLLSPLTGLAIAFGISFTTPLPRPEGPPVPLHEAIKIVGTNHDLASVIWIRPQGGAMRARLYDGREAKVYTVTRS